MKQQEWLKSQKFMEYQKKFAIKSGLQAQEKAKEREREYLKNPKLCKSCQSPLPYKEHNIRQFCSHICAATFNNKNRKTRKKNKNCLFCGISLRGKKGLNYCCQDHQHKYLYQETIKKWKNNKLSGLIGKKYILLAKFIRKYLFEKYNNKCSNTECGWGKMNVFTKKIPLQVHHKDGDFRNNKEENLELFCPNCHSLTSNYGSRNKGNGRKHERFGKNKRDVV